MTLMSMRRKMASKRTAAVILWILIAVFLVGVALWSVPPQGRGGSGGGPESREVVAKVGVDGKHVITRTQLEDEFNKNYQPQYASFYDPDGIIDLRKSSLSNVVEQIVLGLARKKYFVGSGQMALRPFVKDDAEADVMSKRKSAKDTAKTEAETYEKSLEQYQKDLEAWNKKQAAKPKEEKPTVVGTAAPPVKPEESAADKKPEAPKKARTAEEVLADDLKQAAKTYLPDLPADAKVSEKKYKDAYVRYTLNNPNPWSTGDLEKRALGRAIIARDFPSKPEDEAFVEKLSKKKVRASWIFVSARKEGKEEANPGAETVATPGMVKLPDMRPEALAKVRSEVEALRAQVAADPKKLAGLAKEKSTDGRVAEKGGALGTDGWMKEDDSFVPVAVEYWAFSMQPGELSPVTLVAYSTPESSFARGFEVGYAIVKVDEVADRTDLDKDFNWERDKAKRVLEVRKRYESETGQAYLEAMRYLYPTTMVAKEAQLYDALDNHQYLKADKLRKELKDDRALPSVVRAAVCYGLAMATKDMDERLTLLIDALPATGRREGEIRLRIGQLYVTQGDTKNALEQFRTANDVGDEQDRKLRQDLLMEFIKLGSSEDMEKIAKWLEEHPEQPGGGNPFGNMSF